MTTTDPASTPPPWQDYARELGGVIGRSLRPVTFLIGAGASLSSGGPTTSQVSDAFSEAAGVRLGADLMRLIQTLPESEKQDVLAPLFRTITPGVGYLALAALAVHRTVIILNLNWDLAAKTAAEDAGVLRASLDIEDDPGKWPAITAEAHGLYDVHLHGVIGQACRFGTLETLSYSADAEQYLVTNGLAHTMACVGASLNGENDLPALFQRRIRSDDAARPSSQHWYFIRDETSINADDRTRLMLTHGSLGTYVKGRDINFDGLATICVNSALALARRSP